MKKPRLMDLDCTPMRFRPGDRILVRVKVPIDAEQRKKIQKTVERWAGNMVEVLVIDPRMEVHVEQHSEGA